MKITMISILICCIWTVSAAIGPQGQIQQDERTTFQGSIEPVEGSPVALYDARYDLIKNASDPEATKVVGHVKIENVSDRPIRVLRLSFAYKLKFSMTVVAVASDLAPRETRDYSAENFSSPPQANRSGKSLDMNGMALNVMATGAEFKDGSHWAAPRTESRPLAFWPNHAGAYFMSRGWRRDQSPQEALFEVLDAGVVAYRLATVTDTPSSFEVRLGEWADVPGSERHRGGQVIEPGRSLKSDQMPGVARPSGAPGIAVFVSELRFADGHVWR
jgi:hypothetical protein